MGRKRKDVNEKKVILTIAIEQHLKDKLKSEKNKSELISKLLKDYYKRKNM